MNQPVTHEVYPSGVVSLRRHPLEVILINDDLRFDDAWLNGDTRILAAETVIAANNAPGYRHDSGQ